MGIQMIHAMIAEYAGHVRQHGNSPYTNGMGAMITHAVMVAYGEDHDAALERAAGMIVDVMYEMD